MTTTYEHTTVGEAAQRYPGSPLQLDPDHLVFAAFDGEAVALVPYSAGMAEDPMLKDCADQAIASLREKNGRA